MWTNKPIIILIIICLVLSSCNSTQAVNREQYFEYYYSLCNELGFDCTKQELSEDGVIVFTAFNGLFTVGLAFDNKENIIYASISTSEGYENTLKDESDLHRALLSSSYLAMPFYNPNFNDFDEKHISILAGILLSSFDGELVFNNYSFSATHSGFGFEILILKTQ